MNKRHLHHVWRKFRGLKPWYFLIVVAISTVVCVAALRNNNQHMVELRAAVYAADMDNKDVNGALNKLRTYVYAHMNTSLSAGPDAVYPPIQLKYTYDRLVTAAGNQATVDNNKIYTDAQQYCEQQNSTDFSGRNRVPCITEYVSSHTTKTSAIPDYLYKFNFSSPTWSPDVAGWSMVAAIISGGCFLLLFAIQRWFKKNIA